MVDCPYTRACDKITRVLTSCVNMAQLVNAQEWCRRLIRKKFKSDNELYSLKMKIFREQRAVILKTYEIDHIVVLDKS